MIRPTRKQMATSLHVSRSVRKILTRHLADRRLQVHFGPPQALSRIIPSQHETTKSEFWGGRNQAIHAIVRLPFREAGVLHVNLMGEPMRRFIVYLVYTVILLYCLRSNHLAVGGGVVPVLLCCAVLCCTS